MGICHVVTFLGNFPTKAGKVLLFALQVCGKPLDRVVCQLPVSGVPVACGSIRDSSSLCKRSDSCLVFLALVLCDQFVDCWLFHCAPYWVRSWIDLVWIEIVSALILSCAILNASSSVSLVKMSSQVCPIVSQM